MRKIKLFVIAVLMTGLMTGLMAEEVKAFDQCSGTVKVYTSEMKKHKTVKESKLTSLRYIKKICKITTTYKGEDFTAYELDSGSGALYIRRDDKVKLCVLVKDGELYGRCFCKIEGGITATYNLHDKECSIKGVKATEEEITEFTSVLFEGLTEIADKLY